MSFPLRILSRRRNLSIGAVFEQSKHFSTFRTLENDPTNHTAKHIGKFYSVEPETVKTLFGHGGLPRTFRGQCKTFVETCLMIRPPAIEVIDYIKRTDFSKPVNKYLLYGSLGSGKSLSLAHIIHYASVNNFVIVHVPWVASWLRITDKYKEMINSPTREGFVDIPLDAAAWLVHFKSQNYKLLKELDLRLTSEYVWSKREKSEIGSPFLDLIEFGINRIKYANEIIVTIGTELKALSTQKKCKTLVAIDGFNCFFYPETRLKTDTRRNIPPSDVTIRIPFLELTKSDWSNGAVVLTVDKHAVHTLQEESDLPHYLLGKEGFEHIDPFVPINVDGYSDVEFQSVTDYYRDRLWLRGSKELEEELSFTSGRNPYKFMEVCAPL